MLDVAASKGAVVKAARAMLSVHTGKGDRGKKEDVCEVHTGL